MSGLRVLCAVLFCTAGCGLLEWSHAPNRCAYVQSRANLLASCLFLLALREIEHPIEGELSPLVRAHLQRHGAELVPGEWAPFGQTPLGQRDPLLPFPLDWEVQLIDDTLCVRVVDDTKTECVRFDDTASGYTSLNRCR